MASQGTDGLGELRLMALDFSKVFLYGNMQREVYVELPEEDSRRSQTDCVGLLRKSIYGLRDAPQIWQSVVKSMLGIRGFTQLVGTQCTYVNKANGMLIVAHVDDFLVLGRRADLVDLRGALQQNGYECTGSVLGNGPEDASELKFLGRMISLREDGVEWRGDDKHVTAYLEKLLS